MRRTRATLAAAVLVTATAVIGGASAFAALTPRPVVLGDGSTPNSRQDVTGRPGGRPATHGTAGGTDRPAADRASKPDRPASRRDGSGPTVQEDVTGRVVLLGPGDTGAGVRELQARLRQIDWFSGDVTDFYGDVTRAAVAGFQTKRGFGSTGEVDQETLTRLEEMTHEPTADELANVVPVAVATDPADGAALDPRCLTGRVVCIDKTSSSLRYVVDGDVRLSVDARFGGNGHFTREGAFQVLRKSRDHVSSLYDSSMPFAMFFSGGEAVHYSPDFAANGYAGSSHGCVNIRDYDAVAWLFDQVEVGDPVVVYWS